MTAACSLRRTLGSALLVGFVGLLGCSEDLVTPSAPAAPSSPSVTMDPAEGDFLRTPPGRNHGDRGPAEPAGRVSADLGATALELWPWTGSDLAGSRVDPVNVVFVGHADPLQIRAALLALDGDRTSLGAPNSYPFDQTWSDAYGDVQTTWTDPSGWTGSVVQLQLGQYDPMRFHLRLFPPVDGGPGVGTITVGAAHLDLHVPDTADHVPLSWERAREIVVGDLVRAGVVDGVTGVMASGPYTDVPSYRTIPAPIYDALPLSMKIYLGGPTEPVTENVPIANDGMVAVLHVATPTTVPDGRWVDRFTMTYDRVVPKPLCNAGPLDYVLVRGPVDFERMTMVNPFGRYVYSARYSGTLTVVPVDVTVSPPAPIGEPYTAEVSGEQHGMLYPRWFSLQSNDRRFAEVDGEVQQLVVRLQLRSRGAIDYRTWSVCPDPAF